MREEIYVARDAAFCYSRNMAKRRIAKTWQDLIDDFGGPHQFADVIDVSKEASRQMASRNSVPSTYWSKIVTRAPACGVDGVTYDFLVGLKTGRFRPPEVTPEPANHVA